VQCVGYSGSMFVVYLLYMNVENIYTSEQYEVKLRNLVIKMSG